MAISQIGLGKGAPPNLVVSFSGGKDSTAMLHMLIERQEPIAEVVWYVTPWEFPEMHEHVDRVAARTDLPITRLQPRRDWTVLLARRGWPHPAGGWCTAAKRDDINAHLRGLDDITECIGFDAGEERRACRESLTKRKHWPLRFPLIEWGVTGAAALAYCRRLGYDWGGLYDWMPSGRVSCWCCPKQGKRDLRALREYRPALYECLLRRGHPKALAVEAQDAHRLTVEAKR